MYYNNFMKKYAFEKGNILESLKKYIIDILLYEALCLQIDENMSREIFSDIYKIPTYFYIYIYISWFKFLHAIIYRNAE